MQPCLECGRVGQMYWAPFCNSSCRLSYLITVENSAFHKGVLKYPEFLVELKEWYACQPGQQPRIVNGRSRNYCLA